MADWCPDCDRLRVFSIEEKRQQWEVLGVPVGREFRAARRRVCWECGLWAFLPSLRRYSDLVTIHEAERLPLRTILRTTNPDLFDELEEDRDR